MRSNLILAWILIVVSIAACGQKKTADNTVKNEKEKAVPKVDKNELTPKGETIEAKLKKFTQVDIGVDEAAVKNKHKPVLKKLIEAARVMDRLFLHQVSKDNVKWREAIGADPALKSTLAYFDIMYGPWDRLDHDKPFWGNKEKPETVTFYPEDLTPKALETWILDHPEDKAAFTGYFTVIERKNNDLKAVPYNLAYKPFLEPAATLLEEAAALAEDKRLATYLKSRAKAFRDNEYQKSDMDWMDLGDGDIEVVIGPYEVYEDALMGYKAAFEAFITLRDPEDSKALAKIKSFMKDMEAYLPIPEEHKNLNRGFQSPISVVDVLFTAGDTRAGVQTIAFNLPNDEVVREKKGSKKVMLKNVARAKYDKILVPIATRLMQKDQADKVSFEAFFNHTLVHETAHGLGPGKITVEKDGQKINSSVNAELKELYPTIEEAKADVLGMYLNFFLIEQGLHEEEFKENMYASFLGGFFRSVRFGANEAHGQANVIQFNYLKEKGAITKNENGRYGYDALKMPGAVKQLAHDLLMIEALGDYDGAKGLIQKYGQMPKTLEAELTALGDIPTDICPVYRVEQQMKDW